MWKNSSSNSSATTLLVTLGVVILSVALGAAASSSMIRKRKKNASAGKKNDTTSRSSSTTTPSLPARNDASSIGNDNAMFCASANSIKNLNSSALANAEKLQLYSLFKQATVGNAPKWFSPSSYDLLTEQAKHHAWSQLRGKMTQPEATQAYIKVAQSLLLQVAQNGCRSNDDNDDDDDDESIDHDALSDDEVDYSKPQPGVVSNKHKTTNNNTNPTDPDGFGVGVSRPIEQEEEESDGEDTSNKPPHVALLQAASKNDIATIQRLANTTVPGTVERSRLVDHTDEMGQTALHLAADAGHDNAVRCLISAGANVAAADQDGISVLQAAVIAGKVETSRILWQEGHADPDQADHDGDTPRHCAQDDGSFAMKRLFEGIPVATIKEDSAVLNVSSYSTGSGADTIDEEEDEGTQDTEAETATVDMNIPPTPEQQQRKQKTGGKDATDKRLIAV